MKANPFPETPCKHTLRPDLHRQKIALRKKGTETRVILKSFKPIINMDFGKCQEFERTFERKIYNVIENLNKRQYKR